MILPFEPETRLVTLSSIGLDWTLTFCDIVQRAPDEMLDASLLSRISYVPALLLLDFGIRRLPEVCNCKDGVSASECFDQGCLVIRVGLEMPVSAACCEQGAGTLDSRIQALRRALGALVLSLLLCLA